MNLAGAAGVHSLPDELLIRVFSLILLGAEIPPEYGGMLRSVPLWLLLVCKKWHTLLSGPSVLFASFYVELRSDEYPASNSAVRVLLARLRGARALKICCYREEPFSAPEAIFVRLLCNLDSLPLLDSLAVGLPESEYYTDLTSEQRRGMRRISQLASLRSLRVEGLQHRELQLLQDYSALSCLTCLHLELKNDYSVRVPHTIVLPSFVLQLQRLQSLTLDVEDCSAGIVLPKVDPMARLLLLLM